MRCCTDTPQGLSPEEQDKRREAIKAIQEGLEKAKELGYLVHIAYSDQYFFMEPAVLKR